MQINLAAGGAGRQWAGKGRRKAAGRTNRPGPRAAQAEVTFSSRAGFFSAARFFSMKREASGPSMT